MKKKSQDYPEPSLMNNSLDMTLKNEGDLRRDYYQ